MGFGTAVGICVTKLPDDAVRRLKELAVAADREIGPVRDFVFPILRRTPMPGYAPLRTVIDYQSTPRKMFLFCDACGGVVDSKDDHGKDPDACEREKVRRIMES